MAFLASKIVDSPRFSKPPRFYDVDATPFVALPNLSNFRDVLTVIDARERTLQNIKTFLASMMFIRGNARSLPPDVLRLGRGKLARLFLSLIHI